MALTMCQVLQGLPAPVLARVPWNEPGIIMKCLDAGFAGLICPMINSADDARRLVEAARYAPIGGRSFGPARANLVHGAGYAKGANTSVVVLAMIETREALENLGEILPVVGIDGVYVGPRYWHVSCKFDAGWTSRRADLPADHGKQPENSRPFQRQLPSL